MSISDDKILKDKIRGILMNPRIKCEFNTDPVNIGVKGYDTFIQKGDLDTKIDAIVAAVKEERAKIPKETLNNDRTE